MTIILIIILYIIGAILSYGLAFAHMQGIYPEVAEKMYKEDRNFAVSMAVFSWIGVLVALGKGAGKYGLKFR
jgi:hypothetical protein